MAEQNKLRGRTVARPEMRVTSRQSEFCNLPSIVFHKKLERSYNSLGLHSLPLQCKRNAVWSISAMRPAPSPIPAAPELRTQTSSRIKSCGTLICIFLFTLSGVKFLLLHQFWLLRSQDETNASRCCRGCDPEVLAQHLIWVFRG